MCVYIVFYINVDDMHSMLITENIRLFENRNNLFWF